MNNKEALEILKHFQKWRLGSDCKQPDPKLITIALKVAIKLLENLPNPDCHFQDESGKWVWAYSKELIDKTFK